LDYAGVTPYLEIINRAKTARQQGENEMFITTYRYNPDTTNAFSGAWANGAVISSEHRTERSAAKFVRELLSEAAKMHVEIQWLRTKRTTSKALNDSRRSYGK
jgi:hypothetical protein